MNVMNRGVMSWNSPVRATRVIRPEQLKHWQRVRRERELNLSQSATALSLSLTFFSSGLCKDEVFSSSVNCFIKCSFKGTHSLNMQHSFTIPFYRFFIWCTNRYKDSFHSRHKETPRNNGSLFLPEERSFFFFCDFLSHNCEEKKS